ncbi:hypothetical protein Taro_025293 [Colocasia esculenta]|uniref:Uncharacterized protein n=1 Tax=Colocasia esculenta TaxID=4460 RepID=A0A843VH54_COLES|nr:hypothetical protein [Colocasia esculenta]
MRDLGRVVVDCEELVIHLPLIYGRVEELLVAEELWNDHKKPFFFPFSSAVTCTNHSLEVDQRARRVSKGSNLAPMMASHRYTVNHGRQYLHLSDQLRALSPSLAVKHPLSGTRMTRLKGIPQGTIFFYWEVLLVLKNLPRLQETICTNGKTRFRVKIYAFLAWPRRASSPNSILAMASRGRHGVQAQDDKQRCEERGEQ